MLDVKEYLEFSDPIHNLKQWMKEASSHPQIKEPRALVLSTVSHEHIPSSRVVLIKDILEDGIIFYTNTTSKKASHLKKNNYCCGHIYWDALYKQISMIGKATPITREKTCSYWKKRPRESQLSQRISNQSSPVSDRKELVKLLDAEKLRWEGKEVECPVNWSGYSFKIESIEFWIGKDHRLHDRFLFRKMSGGDWDIQRLFP